MGFSPVFLLGILIFKGLTVRPLYKSFGMKGLTNLTFYEGISLVLPLLGTFGHAALRDE
jgi:hypothetical protein